MAYSGKAVVAMASLASGSALPAASPVPPALESAARRTAGLVRVFKTHVPGQIERLEHAVVKGDHAERRAAAHRLKGSCLAFAAPRMTELSRLLEQDDQDHRALVAALAEELARVLALLSAEEQTAR